MNARLSPLLLLTLLGSPLLAAPVLRELPAKIDPKAEYLVYLHGRIIEDKGLRPTHPQHGVYEYEQILQIFADEGFTVLSEPRPAGTDEKRYAGKAARQVRALLAAGVPPERITVVGYSKGGVIALATSTRLKNDKVNFVILAGCGDWAAKNVKPDLRGRVLSLYDASDDTVTSCQKIFGMATGPFVHEEVRLDLGTGHGAFYRPGGGWIARVVQWARRR